MTATLSECVDHRWTTLMPPKVLFRGHRCKLSVVACGCSCVGHWTCSQWRQFPSLFLKYLSWSLCWQGFGMILAELSDVVPGTPLPLSSGLVSALVPCAGLVDASITGRLPKSNGHSENYCCSRQFPDLNLSRIPLVFLVSVSCQEQLKHYDDSYLSSRLVF